MILKVAIIEAGANLVPDINKTSDRMLQSNCGQFYEKTVREKTENEKEIKCVLSLRIVLIYDVGQVSDQ